jgi:hypothetical protein
MFFFKEEGGGYRLFLSSSRVVGYSCEAVFAWIRFELKCWIRIRVEKKMHFSIFAKIQKSCKNVLIFTKFQKILLHKNFGFCKNFTKISRKFHEKFPENQHFFERFCAKGKISWSDTARMGR